MGGGEKGLGRKVGYEEKVIPCRGMLQTLPTGHKHGFCPTAAAPWNQKILIKVEKKIWE